MTKIVRAALRIGVLHDCAIARLRAPCFNGGKIALADHAVVALQQSAARPSGNTAVEAKHARRSRTRGYVAQALTLGSARILRRSPVERVAGHIARQLRSRGLK